jgi:hypothetical protein
MMQGSTADPRKVEIRNPWLATGRCAIAWIGLLDISIKPKVAEQVIAWLGRIRVTGR